MEELAQVFGVHLRIRDSKHPNTQGLDLRVALEVANWMPVLLVDGAVQLDGDPQLGTIEVHDEWPHDLLTPKSQPQHSPATEEFPCPPLGISCLPPEVSCPIEQQGILVLTGDDTPACRTSGQIRLPRSLARVAIDVRNTGTISPRVGTSDRVGSPPSP